MRMVSHLEQAMPKRPGAVSQPEASRPRRLARACPISGVARLKVVAVPARRAKTAKRSMSFPGALSTREPRMGRQASEYFCFLQFLTWSMKPKDTARTR